MKRKSTNVRQAIGETSIPPCLLSLLFSTNEASSTCVGLDLPGLGSSTESRSADRARDFTGGGPTPRKLPLRQDGFWPRVVLPEEPLNVVLYMNFIQDTHVCISARLVNFVGKHFSRKNLPAGSGLRPLAPQTPHHGDHLTWATKTPDALLRINYRLHPYSHAGCIV